MRSANWLVSAGVAAVMVTGTALAGGGSASVGGDVKVGGSVKVPDLRGGLGDPLDGVRKVDERRGPFYGLRVNSMDLAAEAKRVAQFEYAASDILPGGEPRKYQVVRSAWRGEITKNDACDEVLGLPFPADATLTYPAHMITTRWVRDVGPNGRTPVGGFVGELAISVRRGGAGDEAFTLPYISLRIIGTQGLRPSRGDPDDVLASRMERCSAPRHDEGFYNGAFDRRALAFLARAAQDAGETDLERFRALANARLVGTFEGQLTIDDAADPAGRPDRFADLTQGAWWFDGLLGWRAKRVAVAEPL